MPFPSLLPPGAIKDDADDSCRCPRLNLTGLRISLRFFVNALSKSISSIDLSLLSDNFCNDLDRFDCEFVRVLEETFGVLVVVVVIKIFGRTVVGGRVVVNFTVRDRRCGDHGVSVVGNRLVKGKSFVVVGNDRVVGRGRDVVVVMLVGVVVVGFDVVVVNGLNIGDWVVTGIDDGTSICVTRQSIISDAIHRGFLR